MTDNDDQPLAPTAFSPAADLPASESQPPPPRMRGWVPAGIALLALLWVVVFFLPDWVVTTPGSATPALPAAESDEEIANAPRATPAEQADGSEALAPGGSPFADAQLAKARREAQDILQPLLALQEFLEARGVETWAPEAYQSAVALAESGDVAYRERQFDAATRAYRDALAAMEALDARLPEEIAAETTRLVTAIETLEEARANTSLAALQIMAPDSAETANLATRVAVLPQVSAALTEAASAFEAGEFTAAVDSAEQAVGLDGDHEAAGQRLADYREALRQAQFQDAMSQGYAALAVENFAEAEQQFRTADRLSPGAPEPADALVELEVARAAARLRQLRDEAVALESSEQWQAALDRYREALETDSTLVFAAEGIARSEERAELATQVADILASPERLVDRNALSEAQQTLARLEALPDTGPVYRQARSELTETLRIATTPVQVSITSDGLTDVTIARVKRMGTLSTQTITLRPGRYTAVGIRDGFRDVRVSFDVSADGDHAPIDVRCTEAL